LDIWEGIGSQERSTAMNSIARERFQCPQLLANYCFLRQPVELMPRKEMPRGQPPAFCWSAQSARRAPKPMLTVTAVEGSLRAGGANKNNSPAAWFVGGKPQTLTPPPLTQHLRSDADSSSRHCWSAAIQTKPSQVQRATARQRVTATTLAVGPADRFLGNPKK